MRRLLTNLLLAFFITATTTLTTTASDNPYLEYIPKQNEQIYIESSYKYSAIDPTISNNLAGCGYPGMRGSNQLVIYTPSHGVSTNTNEYGAEAIVDRQLVPSNFELSQIGIEDLFIFMAKERKEAQ